MRQAYRPEFGASNHAAKVRRTLIPRELNRFLLFQVAAVRQHLIEGLRTKSAAPLNLLLAVKILFLTLIALVIPLFFLLIFVLGTYNRLVGLRNRCRTASQNPDRDGITESQRQAIEQYDEARRTFPTNMIARLFGFGPEQPVSGNVASSAPSRVSGQ